MPHLGITYILDFHVFCPEYQEMTHVSCHTLKRVVSQQFSVSVCLE